jgi:acyl phosphate:glycerol-3-phosphate acyltransferase
MLSLFLILLLSYLAGSIPTAIIAGRLVMKDDIRNHGSRNAGATNVYRVMGWKPALVVVLIDIGKGVLAALFISRLRIDPLAWHPVLVQIAAGTAAIVGHVWTVFAGFRGGKGVGTAAGVFLSIAPVPVLAALAVWLILLFSTRIMSVASLAAALTLGIALTVQKAFFRPDIPGFLAAGTWAVVVLIVFTHRSNIGRLARGEELKLGSSPGRKKENA